MNTLKRGEIMAGVSNPGLKWSTYQDKQLNILNSLEKSFESSLSVSKQIRDSLTLQSRFLDSMLHASNNQAKNISDLTKALTGSSREFVAKVRRSSTEIDRLYGSVRGASSGMEEFTRETKEASDTLEESSNKLSDAFLEAADKVFSWINKYTDVYKEASNRLMRYTGANLSTSQVTRSDIVDIVEGLNKETGYFFAGDKSYQRLVELSLQANIGSTEALKEVANPLLLAENSMQTDVAKLAELFNKYYIRYNFSSESMESIVGGILTNTAGNMADAAKVAAALEGMSDTIAVYAPRDRQAEYLNQASKAVSWASAYAGISEGQAADWIQKIYRGGAAEDDQLRLLLNYGGLDTSQATNLLRSTGDAGSVLEAIVKGAEELGKLSQAQRSELAYSTRGLDIRTIEGIIAALKGDSFIHFNQFNPEQIDPESVIRDQYVGAGEKASNLASTWMDFLAALEEKMGISLKDIGTMVGAFAAGGVISKISTVLGGTTGGGILGRLGTMGTSLGSIGSALGIGAVATGIYFLVDHFFTKYKEKNWLDDYQEKTITDIKSIYDQGLYPAFDESGNVYGTKDEGIANASGSNLLDSYLPIHDQNNTVFDKVGNWIASIISGVSSDTINEADALKDIEGILSSKTLTTLANSDNPLGKGYADSYKKIIEAYSSKGLLEEDWQWTALTRNLEDVRKSLIDNNELIIYKRNWFTGEFKEKDRIPAYAAGSNYIPHDQLAYIHEGEAIIPKKYNPYAKSSDLDSMKERSERLQEESNEYYSESISTLKEIKSSLEEIKRIKEFLNYWRDDNIKRETIAESRRISSEMAYARGQVTGYLPL